MRNAILLLSTLLGNFLNGQVVFDFTYGNGPHYCRDIEHANNGGFMLSVQTDWPWTNTELYRLNSAGDTLWTRIFGSDTVQFKTYEMISSSDGGYIFCGDHQNLSTQPNMDAYLMKLDSLGHVVWFNRYGISYEDGGDKDYANSVAEYRNTQCVTAGRAKYCFTDSSGLQSGTYFQGYVCIHDSAGNPLISRSLVYCFQADTQTWQHRFYPTDVAVSGNKILVTSIRTEGFIPVDEYGHIVIFDSNLDTVRSYFFPLDNLITSACVANDGTFLIGGDSILAKIDTNGFVIWQRSINIPYGKFTEFSQRPSGEIVVLQGAWGAYIQDDVDVNDANSAMGVAILHYYDSTGIWLRSDTLSTQVTGYRGFADFVLAGDSIVTLAGSGGQRMWVMQFCDTCVALYADEIQPQRSLNVYPNPAANELTIDGLGEYNSFGIFSLTGQQLGGDNVNSIDGSVQIDLTGLCSGLYILQFEAENSPPLSVRFIKK